MKLTTIVLTSVLGLATAGAAGYFGFAQSNQPEPTPQAPETLTVDKCDVRQTVEAPGVLVNTSETPLLMPVSGLLLDVSARPGDRVEAGQVLARLDDRSRADAMIALKDAQEAYKKAHNYRNYLNNKIWLERITFKTIGPHTVPVVHWYRGYADPDTVQDADNDLALKKAKLDEAQATLDAMEIKAPFDGAVVEATAQSGQPYNKNAVLFRLVDTKALEVKANVTQEDYPLLRVGQSAEVYFDARPDVTGQAAVDRINPQLVSGTTPTYDIYLTLKDVPDGLVDGMTVDSNVTISSRTGVLCLPRSLVHASGGNTAMVKVWNGSQTEDRKITLGLRGDADIEILSGISEGEKVVLK